MCDTNVFIHKKRRVGVERRYVRMRDVKVLKEAGVDELGDERERKSETRETRNCGHIMDSLHLPNNANAHGGLAQQLQRPT